MPSEDQPTQPHERKFGSQFYQKPDNFPEDHTEWTAHPEKTITQATMMASLAHAVISASAAAHEVLPEESARRRFPAPDVLGTSRGAAVVNQSTTAINILGNQHVVGANSPEERARRIDEANAARDLGLQGAAQWWAGNITGGGGGGHAPREDLGGVELETGWTEITPDPNINDPNAEFDPYLSYPDTDIAGAGRFHRLHGLPGDPTDPELFIASMLEPMSSMPLNPEDFEDN
jgi:hypothetical protein